MEELDTTKLAASFSGKVIVAGDEEYDVARTTFVVKDAKPAVIAQAKTSQDVSQAVTFAKNAHLQISVRSGGHSSMGFSTNTGGLVLDLSHMDSIEILDAEAGLVRLGSGALWGNVCVELAKHGLALSSGDTKTVAVGGLTLGGGIGWMVRKYGFTIDSLVGAEVVLADGSVVHATATENSDLFWALRGGGGNFGVVTYFDFKAHPEGKVVDSVLMYEPSNLRKMITGWRDHLRSAPEELTSFMTFMPSFGDMPPGVMVMSCYADDDLKHANEVIEPLRHLGNMKSDKTDVKEYADVLQVAHPPAGVKIVNKNMFAKTLDDELVAAIADMCCKPGSPILQIRMINGAVNRIEPHATALMHRDNEVFLFAGFPLSPDATEEQQEQVLEPWKKLAAFSTGAYSNFLSTNTEADVADLYPQETYARLVEVKRKYDPENLFNHNFNIKP